MITPAISKDVAIGRRMNGSEMFKLETECYGGSFFRLTPAGPFGFVLASEALWSRSRVAAGGGSGPTLILSRLSRRRRRRDFDLRSRLQFVLSIHDDFFAGLQP
jgi:hypothetical protein